MSTRHGAQKKLPEEGEIAVFVGVLLAVAIADIVADGTTMMVLMVGLGAVFGLLMRLALPRWDRWMDRRHRQA